jgi:hypothetical protein
VQKGRNIQSFVMKNRVSLVLLFYRSQKSPQKCCLSSHLDTKNQGSLGAGAATGVTRMWMASWLNSHTASFHFSIYCWIAIEFHLVLNNLLLYNWLSRIHAWEDWEDLVEEYKISVRRNKFKRCTVHMVTTDNNNHVSSWKLPRVGFMCFQPHKKYMR